GNKSKNFRIDFGSQRYKTNLIHNTRMKKKYLTKKKTHKSRSYMVVFQWIIAPPFYLYIFLLDVLMLQQQDQLLPQTSWIVSWRTILYLEEAIELRLSYYF